MLDPDIESQQIYFKGTTTGSKQLILGFRLVPIIHEHFAEAYHFEPDESVIYCRGSFAAAFRRALYMEPSDWVQRKVLIAKKATSVYDLSLENLRIKLNNLAN